ncbi:AAA family ATPase [Virgibacillus salinus]|uniref:AAA domain-containing protein n=1 Tax=Virgibacillus salinus TaxID=553311 RepID=A0A1H1E320_9BACI|nr:AAA family ATPase [Virgibacillus salinus]SDQ83000.1 AAA domain-containing protein [Virgibacillus salinus]
MIIMINGAFGVGKTTISNELLNEVEGSMIFDPEEVGSMLRNVIPEEVKQLEAVTGDFQDLHLWKELTVNVAELLISTYKVNLIVPMTIQKPEYLNYIINGFKGIDRQTYHFCLTASKDTISKRLRERGEEDGNWCFQQTDQCLKSFKENNFEEYIDTENIKVSDIIENIKDKLIMES